MEFKNRRFRFFDEVYSLEFVDSISNPDEDAHSFGYTDLVSKRIVIALRDNGGKLHSESHIRNIIRHELMHVILLEGQYLVEGADEPLVEWLAKSLGILIKEKLI